MERLTAVVSCDEVAALGGLSKELAAHYAEDGKHTIIVGCGYVPMSEAAPLGASANAGSAALARSNLRAEDAIVASKINNVDIVRFDEPTEVCDEPAASEAFMHLVEQFTHDYDCVIIVAPYAHNAVDASVVARLADVTLIAAVLGKTRRKNLKKASENLKCSGANVAGVCVVDQEG